MDIILHAANQPYGTTIENPPIVYPGANAMFCSVQDFLRINMGCDGFSKIHGVDGSMGAK
jgi:hypothetical protein